LLLDFRFLDRATASDVDVVVTFATGFSIWSKEAYNDYNLPFACELILVSKLFHNSQNLYNIISTFTLTVQQSNTNTCNST
jgi:hypothetical protein